MNRPPQRVRAGYFGKLPTRSDFVKAADNQHALASLLDRWLADTMNQLTADPRWKLKYDALRPLHFAFIGTRSRHVIAGHLVASNDQSQRRFPFLAMSTLEIDDPAVFLPRSPLVLAPLWDTLAQRIGAATEAMYPAPHLHALASTVVELDADGGQAAEDFAQFLEMHTLAELQAMLSQAGMRVSARQMVLAVGLLLQPLGWSGSTRLDKSLVLPLPGEPLLRAQVAAFWLALAAPFLRHADLELALMVAEAAGRPLLVLGFSGAAPETLRAVIDVQYAAEQQINFDSTDWVDDLIAGDHKVMHLSACLEQDQLSLCAVSALFRETFA